MPELSGQERETAATVSALVAATGADRVITGLGGHGVAAVYDGAEPGPTVMVRAELDGLPIAEISDIPHRSEIAGRSEEHTSELQSLMRNSYAAFCLKKKKANDRHN